MPRVPHLAIIVAFCIAAISGYAALSAWSILMGDDAALRGDIVGTWKSFAVLAFGFWLGSSSGSKTRDAAPSPPITSPEKED